MEYEGNGVKKIETKGASAAKGLLSLALKYKYVLLMVAVGVVLMLLPSFGSERGQDPPGKMGASQSAYSVEQTQERMEKMLSEMDGVGKARVMLTVASGSQYVYQDDRELSYSGSAGAPEDYSSVTETVLLNRSGSGQEALQTQEIYPSYVGALVVCDGAGNAGTVLKVKEAVSVLTGLGTDRISVVKRIES